MAGNFTSLPQYFREHGYITIGMGKIYHEKTGPDPISWSEPFYRPYTTSRYYSRRTNVWESLPDSLLKEYPHPDTLTAERAVKELRRLAEIFRAEGTNFFLAVGFIKPHLPFHYPKEYENYYNLSEIPMPVPYYAAKSMPMAAWHKSRFMKFPVPHYQNITNSFNTPYPIEDTIRFRAGYYRALSFSDAMIGRVLEVFRALDLEDSTVVSFLGDHGWHLGEQGMWQKETNFEVSLRIPMMISVEGLTDGGMETRELVEAVDLFPTLVDLAGLPSIPTCVTTEEITCSEGRSMLPLFYNQSNAIKQYAFSQTKHGAEGRMGYTVRNDRYRYTIWYYHQDKKVIIADELYDYVEDKHETRNVVSDPAYTLIARHLKSVLEHQLGVTTSRLLNSLRPSDANMRR